MSPLVLRNAIVASLRAALPAEDVPNVVAHDGEFRADGPETRTLRAPAVLVACLGCGTVDDAYEPPVASTRWGAFCITRTPDREAGEASRGDAAMALAFTVAGLVAGNRWGVAHGPAEDVTAQNLFATDMAQRGFSLWVVQWEQGLALEPRTDAAALRDLRIVQATYDMQPDTDATQDQTQRIALEAP